MDNSAFDGLSAPDVWDKLGLPAQFQIIFAFGIFEFWSGYFPALKFLPNLYNPFNLRGERLFTEVNMAAWQ